MSTASGWRHHSQGAGCPRHISACWDQVLLSMLYSQTRRCPGCVSTAAEPWVRSVTRSACLCTVGEGDQDLETWDIGQAVSL